MTYDQLQQCICVFGSYWYALYNLFWNHIFLMLWLLILKKTLIATTKRIAAGIAKVFSQKMFLTGFKRKAKGDRKRNGSSFSEWQVEAQGW